MSAAEWYNHTTFPTQGSLGTSSTMRTELDAIESGISAKLPDLAGNGSKIVAVNAGATALEAITTTGTGSGVRATSPTLVTPVLGVAAATSINKVTLTAPATSCTFTLLDGKTFTVNNTLTIAGTDGSTLNIGTGGTLGTAAFTAASAYIAVDGALGTPVSGVLTNCTGTAAGLTAGVATLANGLKSATTTVAVSAATAPSSGQVLTATSDSAATWQTPAAAGAMVYLSTVTASASATVDVETTFDSTYDAYVIVASGVKASDAGSLRLLMKIGGSYVGSGYYGHINSSTSGSALYAGAVASNSAVVTLCATGASAADSVNFVLYVFNPASTALAKAAKFIGTSVVGTVTHTVDGSIANTGTSALTGVRFSNTANTIASGKFRLYGIKNS